ncbi:PTS sugar transporter subunit IIA [Brevibacillus migulae]|uniref:PTS sugar transporter subunit IIA n=1 Tax=Brevibacillus migulae TaxID=1644114 RepID=UPI00106E154A|nr:PTS glucose transporter subunit IIA [Brevibacillus migulae]
MFQKWFSKKKESTTIAIAAPLTGRVMPLEEVPDPVFAQKMAGDGIAILPTDGLLVSPVSGKVAHVFPTHHAIGLVNAEGLELLIHIGIDTVKLNGEGFQPFVQVGDQVSVGDKLIHFDLEKIKAAGYSLITPVLITNHEMLASITFTAGAEVQAGSGIVMEALLK